MYPFFFWQLVAQLGCAAGAGGAAACCFTAALLLQALEALLAGMSVG
jgi:hypothetical protein